MGATPAFADPRELSDLFLNDNGTVRPYVDVVQPAGAEGSTWGVPLPSSFISVANFQNAEQWLKGYDFDRDGWLTLAEITQGWLVKTAQWKTGKTFKPGDLMTAPSQTLQGVRISVRAERAVRATINAMVDRAGSSGHAARTEILRSLNTVSSAVLDSGGDGGAGSDGERDRQNDDDKDRPD